MADEITPQTPPAGTPPAAAPAAAAAATPPAAAAAPAAAPRPPKPQGNRPPPFDQTPGFKKRVEQEAARIIKRTLGLTAEEAKVKLAGVGDGAPPAAAAAPAAGPPPAASSGRESKLEKENRELRERTERQNLKIKKIKAKAKDRLIELEFRHDAVRAGIIDEHADFALDLYAKACRAGGDNPPDSLPFFQGLRATRAYLFSGPTPVVVASPTTSPPESGQPGEAKPKPTPPASPAPSVDVDKMDQRQFDGHLQKYGYRRGA